MRGVTFFSGLGGVDAGIKMAGVEPVAAIECDPNRLDYSNSMAIAHKKNFPNSQFLKTPIESVNWQDLAILRPDIVHASPMCSNFCSISNLNGSKESTTDKMLAQATADGIESILPSYFSLEQAPEYLYSESFKIIRDRLKRMDYQIKTHVADMAYFGVPQHRKRMFALCWRPGQKEWKFPTTTRLVGWREAIAGTENTLEECEFTDRQSQRIEEEAIAGNLMVQRISVSKKLVVREATQPSWAICRDHFSDNKGGTRSKIATARIDGKAQNLSIRAIARLCSFPDWFYLPERFAGMGLGYAVPPLMMKKIYQMIE